MKSLRSILIQVFLFLLLISPSLLISSISYIQLKSQLTKQTYAERLYLAKLMANTVEARLDDVRDIGIVSASDISDYVEKKDWEGAVNQISHISEEFPFIDRIFLSDLEGRTTAYFPPSPENLNKDFSYRDWYKGVSKEWKPYASEVFKRAPQPQFNTIAIMSPILNDDGQPMGAIGFAINLNSFYDLSQSVTVGQGGFLYIVNQKGQIVAHPKYPSQGEIIDYSSVEIVQKVINNQSGVEVQYNPVENEERLAAFEPVHPYGWGVILTEPVATAFSERDSTLRNLVIVSSLLIFINAIFASIILRTLRRIRLANAKLKELDTLKDEFVSIASHELRTPMGAIRSFVSMILSGDYGTVPDNLIEPLKDIKASTERLVNLVNDLLHVARIESGRMKFTLVDANITNVVSDVIKILEPLAKEKNVALEFTSTLDVQIQMDTDKIKQVLTNLIGNSLKFTDKGSISVLMKDSGEMVEIDVTDTGVGISKKDQQKLFSKFEQVAVSGDRPSGTGLGLYISREIISKLGGRLWIKASEVGGGTTMTFTLPKSGTQNALNVKSKIQQESLANPDQK